MSKTPLHIRITHQTKVLGTAVAEVPSSVVPSEPAADEIAALRERVAELEAALREALGFVEDVSRPAAKRIGRALEPADGR